MKPFTTKSIGYWNGKVLSRGLHHWLLLYTECIMGQAHI